MTDDTDLSAANIQVLSSRDGVVSFFASLGYDTDTRLPQTPAAMGITDERQILLRECRSEASSSELTQ